MNKYTSTRWFSTRLSLAGCVALVFVFLLPAHYALADGLEVVPNQLLVKFDPKQVDAVKGEVEAAVNIKIKSLRQLGRLDWHLATVDTDRSLQKSIAAFKQNLRVSKAEPNYICTIAAPSQTIPDDPDFDKLWGLLNTGQTGGTQGADISATEAWGVITHADIIVAVIDTGIDYSHPDLAANIWTSPHGTCGWDFVNNDADPMDDHGHGTHVAGTIGAAGNNAVGVTGVCWSVELMAVKALGADGTGTTAGVVEAILFAVDSGASIINASWGGGSYSEAMFDAIDYARENGVLFVAAAGNSSRNNDTTSYYPATYQLSNLMAVAATDHDDNLASFSNYGASTVHLGAPGVNIYSTKPDGNYASMNGTSMAAPHAAGAAALLRAVDSSLTCEEIITLLMDNADEVPSLAGKTISAGRLNLRNAVYAISPGRRIVISSPEAERNYEQGTLLNIRWNAFGTACEPTDTVSIEYSSNAGTDWTPIPGAEELPYDARTFVWDTSQAQASAESLIRMTFLQDTESYTVSPLFGITGEFDHFEVDIASPQANGWLLRGSCIVTAKDAGGMTITNFSTFKPAERFPVAISSAQASISGLTGGGNTLNATDFSNGVADLTAMRMVITVDEATDITLIAASADDRTGESNVVHVYDVEPVYVRAGSYGDGTIENPFGAIQDAIDMVSTGQIIRNPIMVAQGRYDENLIIDSVYIDIEGGWNADFTDRDWSAYTTTIYGSNAGSCVSYYNAEGGSLSGFTLERGRADWGAGIYCEASSPVIMNNFITRNTSAIYRDGGGIFTLDASPIIIKNTLTKNTAMWGSGISSHGGSPLITENLVFDNFANRSGAIDFYASDGFILDNLILENWASRYGAGLYFDNCFNSTATNNILSRNEAAYGGGGIYVVYSIITINKMTITENSAAYGGGLGLFNAEVNLFNSILWNNFGQTAEELYVSCDFYHTILDVRYTNVDMTKATAASSIFATSELNVLDGVIDTAPLFVSPETGDYRLKSAAGRWSPAGDEWVSDGVTSPCIDAGDPEDDYTGEQEPNGGRLNMGAYANRSEASQTPASTYTLSVTSYPVDSIDVTGGKPGTTPYTAECLDKTLLKLTAPSELEDDGLIYEFVNWYVGGIPQGNKMRTVELHMDTNREAQARYRPRAYYFWDTVDSTQIVDVPFDVTITALDSTGEVYQEYSDPVLLSASAGGIGGELIVGHEDYIWRNIIWTGARGSRAEILYYAEELGGPDVITAIGLDVVEAPGRSLVEFTIRMQHSTAEHLGTRSYVADGWQVVYQNDLHIERTGWHIFTFDAPFAYNGADNLLVDISFRSSPATAGGAVRYTRTDLPRTRHLQSTSISSPLSWTSGAYWSYRIPAMKFFGVSTGVSPSVTGEFFDGVWHGQVAIHQEREKVHLRAGTVSEYLSRSNEFKVQYHTLTVMSNPISDVFIEGDAGSSTHFTRKCSHNEVVNLTAPVKVNCDGTYFNLSRWYIEGEPQQELLEHLELTIQDDTIVRAEYVPSGDIDSDGYIDTVDLIYIRNHLGADISSQAAQLADVNNDNTVDIADLVYLRNRLYDPWEGPLIEIESPSGQSIDYGLTQLDAEVDAKTILLRNRGDYPVRIDSLTLSGVNKDEFSVEVTGGQGGFPVVIAPGDSLQLQVHLDAKCAGEKSAELSVYHNSVNQNYPVVIPLHAWAFLTEMVKVPAGTFTTSTGVDVYLDSFIVDKYLVTNNLYCRFLNSGGQHEHWRTEMDITRTGTSVSTYVFEPKDGCETYPVRAVYWADIVTFLEWREDVEGVPTGTYSLPTEAQWEKAAGWDAASRKLWLYAVAKDELDTDDANYNNHVGHATPVGSYHPNRSCYGLYDMTGNVWEWCRDRYSYDVSYPTGTVNPQGPDQGSLRVLRGGSWQTEDPLISRRTYLNEFPTGWVMDDVGFRTMRRLE